ncbi:MAG: hypothetical protein ACNA8W_03265 [Bradymonadaceae bacterium]
MKLQWVVFLVVASAVGLGAGFALAQNAPGKRVVGQVIEDFNGRNGNGLIEEDLEALTGPQMLERGQNKIAAMKVTLEGTTNLMDRARTDERDILKMNCINEKLASIKGFLKVSEQSYVSLSDSVSRTDDEGSRHHYTLIAIAGQKVNILGEEARVCAGEELRYADDTMLDVIIDPNISSPDEVFLGDEHLVMDRLPKMSPYN